MNARGLKRFSFSGTALPKEQAREFMEAASMEDGARAMDKLTKESGELKAAFDALDQAITSLRSDEHGPDDDEDKGEDDMEL